MIFACTLGILCGIVIGRHLKVLALVPVQLLAIVVLGSMVLSGRAPALEAGLDFLVWSVGLQLSFAVTGLLSATTRSRSWQRPRQV